MARRLVTVNSSVDKPPPRVKRTMIPATIEMAVGMGDIASMLEHQRESIGKELAMLDQLMQRASEQASRNEVYDVKLGSHIAWVSSKRAEIVSHLRQLEKHERLMAKTPEQRWQLVCHYVQHELDPMRRAELGELIASMAVERRVLS